MIQYIKLVDGDELVGDVTEDKDSFIVFNPLQTFLKELENGRFIFDMTQYLIYTAGDNITIPKRSVLYSGNVSNEILEFYYNALEYVQKNMAPAVKQAILATSASVRSSLDNDHKPSDPVFSMNPKNTLH
jgi:hypothetical protein